MKRKKLHGAEKVAFLKRMAAGRAKANRKHHSRYHTKSSSRRSSPSTRVVVKTNPLPLRRKRAISRGVTLSQAGIKRVAMPAAVAGVGALGLDVLMGQIGKFLPENMQTGTLNSIVKLAGAVGLGALVSKFGSKEMGEAVAVGGVTVTVHDIARAFIQEKAPQIPLAGMQSSGVGLYDIEALSAYSLGYYNPAPLTSEALGMGMFSDSVAAMGT